MIHSMLPPGPASVTGLNREDEKTRGGQKMAYAVIYQDAIWGVGLDRDEAKQDSLEWLNSGLDHDVSPWTPDAILDADHKVDCTNQPYCVPANDNLIEVVSTYGSVSYEWQNTASPNKQEITLRD